MKKAWVTNQVIRDIAYGNPVELYHPDIAAFYDTDVPNDAENGDSFVAGVLTKQPIPELVAPPTPGPPKPPTVTVIQYKLLFTSAERIATKSSVDPVIIDLQDLMNDPRTQNVDLSLKSVQDALGYMTYIGILTPGRKEQILTGVAQ